MRPQILNSKGQPITLTEREERICMINQKKCNDLGFEIDITTLTTIMKKITEQKFYEIPFADYLPVRVGEGAWSSNLVTYRSFNVADDFATGILNMGGGNARLGRADAAVDSIAVPVRNWAKGIDWTLMDLQQAAKAGNWDIVTAKEKARKRNWDLGLQKVAFLGLSGDSSVLGILNQTGVNSNLLVLTQKLSSMTADQLSAFLASAYEAYRSNCNRTAKPTHFLVPENDFNGLASQSSPTFPIKSKLVVLEEAFQAVTMNKQFKILPNAYADSDISGLGVSRYVLLNYEEESLRMDIPVDYTNTLANSLDNFSFQNVGYGQFTGVKAYRPNEMLYLDF